MKKAMCFMVLVCFVLIFAGCSKQEDNRTSSIEHSLSDYYTESEIDAAIDIVKVYFENHFAVEGCTLTDIWYDEDTVEGAEAEYAQQYDKDQAIIILSNFTTDEKGGNGSLEPNETYENWQWVLVRTKGEAWTLKTWGY